MAEIVILDRRALTTYQLCEVTARLLAYLPMLSADNEFSRSLLLRAE